MYSNSRPRFHWNLLSVSIVVLLVACGGGGGGGGGGDPTPGSATPTTLAVTYSSIPANGVGFDPRDALVLTFNADLGTKLTTPTLVQLTEGTNIVPATVTVAGQILTVKPTSPLKLRTDYKFSLKAGFAGTASTLASDYVLSFKTDVMVFDIKQAVPVNSNLNGAREPIITVGDINGDGRPDIVELGRLQNLPTDASPLTAGYTLNLYAQNLDGSFSKYQQIDFTIGPSSFDLYVSRIVVLDIDGDGVPEILVPEYKSLDATDTGLRIFSRATNGQFQAVGFIPTPYLQRLEVADVDADGRPDLIGSASSQYTGGFQVFLNEGAKSVSAPTGLTTLGVVSTPAGIGDLSVTSLNHDSNRQLVFKQGQSSSAGIIDTVRIDAYSQSARGMFSRDATLSHLFDGICGTVGVAQCGRMTIIDIDADGLPDLILGEGDTVAAAYLRRGSTFVKGFTANFGAFPYVTDVDHDGVDDLIFVANQGQPFVAAGVGTRSTSLLFSTTYPIPLFNDINDRYAAAVADLNGDGLPDVVVDQVNSGIYVAIQHKY